MLSSGYIEIYSMVLFSLVIFITASIRWLHDCKWMNSWIYGLTVALTSLVYLGCLFLLVIGGLVFVIKMFSKTSGYKVVLLRVLQYGIGNFLGFYISAMILSGNWFIGFKRLFASYYELIKILTFDKLQGGREFAFAESFISDRALEVTDISHLYGIISFILFFCILSFITFNGNFRREIMQRVHTGIAILLLAITTFLGFFFYVKIPHLGFADWDVFMFLMYPMNFFAAYVICQGDLLNSFDKIGRKAIVFFKVVWLVFTFAYINPLQKRWNMIPEPKLFGVVYNYSLKQSLSKETLENFTITDAIIFE